MISYSPPPLDVVNTPQVQSHRVEQSDQSDDGERPGGSERDGVAEVEQGRSDGAEDDGELELERVMSAMSS